MASKDKKGRQNKLDSLESVTGNLDLINEILKRVSFKSSIRCSLVCHNWYSLIRNLHSVKKSCKLSGLFYHIPSIPLGRYQYIPLIDVEYDSGFSLNTFLRFNFEHSRILQSCNGFLLLSNSFPMRRYCVYNTSNRERFVLPKLCSDYLISISLAFDGSSSSRFKVVGLVRLSGGSCQICIYSSGEGEEMWRVVNVDGIELESNVKFLNGVFWKNSVVWVNCNWNMPSLRFDIDEEKLLTMVTPPIKYPFIKKDSIHAEESGGRLHFIQFDGYSSFREFHVYELEKNDSKKWLLKYHVDLGDFCKASQQVWDHNNFPFLISLVRGDDEENSALLLYISGQIISYNLKQKTCRKICNVNIDVDQFKYLRKWGHKCIHHHVMPVHFLNSSPSSERTSSNTENVVYHQWSGSRFEALEL